MAGESVFIEAYQNFVTSLGDYGFITTLFFFTALITIYGIFVYYFYKNLSKKNIINLNLNQYNHTEHPVLGKLFAVVFYVLEYLIILPILTFIWFIVLAIFLVVLSKIEDVATILMICAALIAAVRIVSQISSALAQDIAKIVPLTLLGLFLIEPNFFNMGLLLARFQQIPGLVSMIPYYILFVIGIEVIARIVDVIERIFRSREDSETSA